MAKPQRKKHAETPSPASKHERFEAVAMATLRWIEAHGLSRINVTQISKRSGVSRAWIYKYIGATQEDWLLHAVHHFGALLGRFDSADEQADAAIQSPVEWMAASRESWIAMARLGRQIPWLLPLYFQYRSRSGGISEPIRTLESRVHARHSRALERHFGFARTEARSTAELLTGIRSSMAYHVQPPIESTLQGADFEALLAARAEQYSALLSGLVSQGKPAPKAGN